MQTRFTKNISQNTITLEMSEELRQKTYQVLTCLLEDSLAKHLAIVETKKDSATQEAHFSLKSHEFLKTKNPNIFSLRMFEVYYLTIVDTLSREYFRFLPRWGMMLNGVCLIAKDLELPTIEREYSLKDILEEDVGEKYYITPYLRDALIVDL